MLKGAEPLVCTIEGRFRCALDRTDVVRVPEFEAAVRAEIKTCGRLPSVLMGADADSLARWTRCHPGIMPGTKKLYMHARGAHNPRSMQSGPAPGEMACFPYVVTLRWAV